MLPEGLVYDETSPSCLRWVKSGSGKRKDLVAGTCNKVGYWYVSLAEVYNIPKLV